MLGSQQLRDKERTELLNRPIIYFEISLVSANQKFVENIRRLCGKRYGGANSAAFLLVPDPKNSDTIILTTVNREILEPIKSPTRRYEWLKSQANNPDKNWKQFGLIKGSVFFGLGTVGPLLWGLNMLDALCYMNKGNLLTIPNVHRVHQCKSDLELSESDWNRLVAEFRKVVEEKFPTWHDRYNRPVNRVEKNEALEITPDKLDWQVLPPGWWNNPQAVGSKRKAKRLLSSYQLQRINEINKHSPNSWYVGSHLGDHIYYLAVFDHVVVADSPEFGNALYYYFCTANEWKEIFRKTKADALQAGAARIIHFYGWEKKLEELVKKNTN